MVEANWFRQIVEANSSRPIGRNKLLVFLGPNSSQAGMSAGVELFGQELEWVDFSGKRPEMEESLAPLDLDC